MYKNYNAAPIVSKPVAAASDYTHKCILCIPETPLKLSKINWHLKEIHQTNYSMKCVDCGYKGPKEEIIPHFMSSHSKPERNPKWVKFIIGFNEEIPREALPGIREAKSNRNKLLESVSSFHLKKDVTSKNSAKKVPDKPSGSKQNRLQTIKSSTFVGPCSWSKKSTEENSVPNKKVGEPTSKPISKVKPFASSSSSTAHPLHPPLTNSSSAPRKTRDFPLIKYRKIDERDNLPFFCFFCDDLETNDDTKALHHLKDHIKFGFHCNYCNFMDQNLGVVSMHYQNAHPGEPRTFGDDKQLRKGDLNWIHDFIENQFKSSLFEDDGENSDSETEEGIQCILCVRAARLDNETALHFTSLSEFKKHFLEHSRWNRVDCTKCGKTILNNEKKMLRHADDEDEQDATDLFNYRSCATIDNFLEEEILKKSDEFWEYKKRLHKCREFIIKPEKLDFSRLNFNLKNLDAKAIKNVVNEGRGNSSNGKKEMKSSKKRKSVDSKTFYKQKETDDKKVKKDDEESRTIMNRKASKDIKEHTHPKSSEDGKVVTKDCNPSVDRKEHKHTKSSEGGKVFTNERRPSDDQIKHRKPGEDGKVLPKERKPSGDGKEHKHRKPGEDGKAIAKDRRPSEDAKKHKQSKPIEHEKGVTKDNTQSDAAKIAKDRRPSKESKTVTKDRRTVEDSKTSKDHEPSENAEVLKDRKASVDGKTVLMDCKDGEKAKEFKDRRPSEEVVKATRDLKTNDEVKVIKERRHCGFVNPVNKNKVVQSVKRSVSETDEKDNCTLEKRSKLSESTDVKKLNVESIREPSNDTNKRKDPDITSTIIKKVEKRVRTIEPVNVSATETNVSNIVTNNSNETTSSVNDKAGSNDIQKLRDYRKPSSTESNSSETNSNAEKAISDTPKILDIEKIATGDSVETSDVAALSNTSEAQTNSDSVLDKDPISHPKTDQPDKVGELETITATVNTNEPINPQSVMDDKNVTKIDEVNSDETMTSNESSITEKVLMSPPKPDSKKLDELKRSMKLGWVGCGHCALPFESSKAYLKHFRETHPGLSKYKITPFVNGGEAKLP